jgi:hypothetical protein
MIVTGNFSPAFLCVLLTLACTHAYADDSTSNSPYIDSLQKQLKEKDAGRNPQPTYDNPQPYIDSIKRKMDAKGAAPVSPSGDNPEPYIDQLKSQNPSLRDGSVPPSYTEQEKAKLGPDHSTGAIQAVKDGNSALSMKRLGEIHNQFSLNVGTFYSHKAVTPADISTPGFQKVYGSGYTPDVRFQIEHYLIYGDNTFSLGVMAFTGIQYFVGSGIFATTIIQPDGSTPFPSQSRTRFAFVNLPVGIGPSFHLNLARWIRPYVQLMPTGMIFFESRNDSLSGHHGKALGYTATAGVAIMMDWISKDTTWLLYRDYGIKHVYFTAEYSRMETPWTAVDFQYSGLNMGFAFDF